ncbi:MAG TPA: hypothetical protein VJ553_05260 [Candidatus Paceibacterota bacterium]|nr:hypothetical protein [Candidatus Paceibacterota bacterium]
MSEAFDDCEASAMDQMALEDVNADLRRELAKAQAIHIGDGGDGKDLLIKTLREELAAVSFDNAGLREALKSSNNWAKMFLTGCQIHESQEGCCDEDTTRADAALSSHPDEMVKRVCEALIDVKRDMENCGLSSTSKGWPFCAYCLRQVTGEEIDSLLASLGGKV